MINQRRVGATSANFPLGGELPEVNFDFTSGLNGDAILVDEGFRTMAGLTLAVAAQQIPPHILKDHARNRDLSLRVLVVPKEFTGNGMPMQPGVAEAELGFYLQGSSLTVSGRQGREPVSGAQFGWLGSARGTDGRWLPARAYASKQDGGLSDYQSVPIRPLERDPAHRGEGYDRLIAAAYNLGAAATHAVDCLAKPGKYGIQVEVNGRSTITPTVSDPELARMRQGQAAFRAALLNGSI